MTEPASMTLSEKFSLLILNNHVCCWVLKPADYKDVPGYDGAYSVSIYGTVWSRLVKVGFGKWINGDDDKWHQLTARYDDKGYLFLGLCKNGKQKTVRVHQLVAQAFIGPCPLGLEACHNDGDHANNNNLCNLRYDTHENNSADMIKHGRSLRGERHHNASLTQEQVDDIRARCAAGETQTSVAKKYATTQINVSYIVRNKTWVRP